MADVLDIPIHQISSLCPECNTKINARIVERAGSIYQISECSAHGIMETLIFSSADLYKKLENWNAYVFDCFTEKLSLNSRNQPNDCISSLHTPTLGVIDLTNRCNYNCPMCFADNINEDNNYFLSLDTVRSMLQILLEQIPAPCRNVQFSGGEPTLHPDFPEILKMAQNMGFSHIQVATNGSRFLQPDYVSLCEEMGLHTLYLQFDGLSDEVYLKLRGKRLLDQKLKIVDNIARTNMRIVLVPTISNSVNVDQIGAIFKYALQYSKHVTGISIQPAAYTGRVNISSPDRICFNLADMAIEFGNQTGLTRFPDDWFPLNAIALITSAIENIRGDILPHPLCDAHCSLGTYFYVDENNNAACLNRFLDMDRFFKQLGRVEPKGTHNYFLERIYRLKELKSVKGCFDKHNAPEGLTFERLLRGLDGWEDKSLGRGKDWDKKGYNGIFVAGMHFMDSKNYNLRRLHRCIIQYVTTDGKLVPFCSYNSGLRYRDLEESKRKSATGSYRDASEESAILFK